MNWINTEDRMPESEDITCVVWLDGDYEFAWWVEGTNHWDSPEYGWTKWDRVTRWVALPKEVKS